MNYKEFIQKYEELLNSGYCECNELNCLDNNPPKKILNIMKEQQQEIERLNNIINGMEKFFQYAYDNEVRPLYDRKVSVWTICLDKLQELKGDNYEN